jgi:hypothetical protein
VLRQVPGVYFVRYREDAKDETLSRILGIFGHLFAGGLRLFVFAENQPEDAIEKSHGERSRTADGLVVKRWGKALGKTARSSRNEIPSTKCRGPAL